IGDREKVGEDRDQVEEKNDEQAGDGELVPSKPPPRQLQLACLRQPFVGREDDRTHARPCRRMRGSIHISSRSETSVPITVNTPSSSTIEPARNLSCATSACSSSGPTVGSPSTSDTTMLPETRYGNRYALELANGLRAARTGYFSTTRDSGRPFARAVTT